MGCRILRGAQRQRREILRYRAQEAGTRSAQELRAAFRDAVERIAGWSPPGTSRTDLAPEIYRFVLVYPYWVIWRRDERGNRVIVAFIDARRDIPAMTLE